MQLHISISPKNVKLNIDCQEVGEKPIKEANNITTEGYEVLGKVAKSGGSKKQSTTVSTNRTSETINTINQPCVFIVFSNSLSHVLPTILVWMDSIVSVVLFNVPLGAYGHVIFLIPRPAAQ